MVGGSVVRALGDSWNSSSSRYGEPLGSPDGLDSTDITPVVGRNPFTQTAASPPTGAEDAMEGAVSRVRDTLCCILHCRGVHVGSHRRTRAPPLYPATQVWRQSDSAVQRRMH
jgi:hypothetical protein